MVFAGIACSKTGLVHCREAAVEVVKKRRLESSLIWVPVKFKFDDVDTDMSVTFATMKNGILYKPKDTQYEFTDMLWIDADNSNILHLLQVSLYLPHAKAVGTFNTLLKKLDVPQNVKFIVHYITDPRTVNEVKAQETPSFMWSNITTGKDKIEHISSRISVKVIKFSLGKARQG